MLMDLDVVLFLDFVAGEEFLLGVDAVFQEQFYVFSAIRRGNASAQLGRSKSPRL